MIRRVILGVMAATLLSGPVRAQDTGTAAGKGTIDDPSAPAGAAGKVAFQPHYSYAYVEGAGARRSTWIVLTEKTPPVKIWMAAKDQGEARRQWCEKEKTSFVAVKLDAKFAVDLYFLCPANGGLNTEMLSTWNGLESVALKFEIRDDKHLKGTLHTGQGSCPGPGGRGQAYCTPTGDYTFDSPIAK